MGLLAAKGYAALGHIKDSTRVLERLLNTENYRLEYIKEAAKLDEKEMTPEQQKAKVNFVIATLNISYPNGVSEYGLAPSQKADFIRSIKTSDMRMQIVQGLLEPKKWDDVQTAATLACYVDVHKASPACESEKIAIRALIDPNQFNILGEDAADRLSYKENGDQSGLYELSAHKIFHNKALQGIHNGATDVTDVLMADMQTLDKFIQSYNTYAASLEPKLPPIDYATLIPEPKKGFAKNGDHSRVKLINLLFDANVKDIYQAGQPLSTEMNEQLVMITNLIGDVLIDGEFHGDYGPKREAGNFLKKLILMENKHKLEGNKLDMMKDNMGEQSGTLTDIPEFEGQGAQILKLLAENNYYQRKDMAKRIYDELAIEVQTMRKGQNIQTGVVSRYGGPT